MKSFKRTKTNTTISDRFIEGFITMPNRILDVCSKNRLILNKNFPQINLNTEPPSFLRMLIRSFYGEFIVKYKVCSEDNRELNIIGGKRTISIELSKYPKLSKFIYSNILYNTEIKNINNKSIQEKMMEMQSSAEIYDNFYLWYSEKISRLFGFESYYAVERNITDLRRFVEENSVAYKKKVYCRNLKETYDIRDDFDIEIWCKF